MGEMRLISGNYREVLVKACRQRYILGVGSSDYNSIIYNLIDAE